MGFRGGLLCLGQHIANIGPCRGGSSSGWITIELFRLMHEKPGDAESQRSALFTESVPSTVLGEHGYQILYPYSHRHHYPHLINIKTEMAPAIACHKHVSFLSSVQCAGPLDGAGSVSVPHPHIGTVHWVLSAGWKV